MKTELFIALMLSIFPSILTWSVIQNHFVNSIVLIIWVIPILSYFVSEWIISKDEELYYEIPYYWLSEQQNQTGVNNQ